MPVCITPCPACPPAPAAPARLLLTSQLSPEQRELADTILDSSLSLLGTLGDILDFSLLEAAPEVRIATGIAL